MSPRQRLWSVTKRKFSQFCEHCTLHGAFYLGGGGALRAVWAFALGCSLALCCFLSHMIWEKFVLDPTLTIVETTHYSTSDIPFPAVVICDTQPVHGPNTANITNLLRLRGYNRTQIKEFYENFGNVVKNEYREPAPYVKKMHYILDDLGYDWMTLLDILKKPCEEIVVECSWRSHPHNCSEMFRPVYTVMGYCCQFDIPYFKLHASAETNFVAGVQTNEALDIIVSGARVSPEGVVTNGILQMYVFDIKDRVTLLDSPMPVTPASYFDVNVYLWAIDSSSYVKALDLHSRKCILDTDGIGTSFYQGCLTRLILKRVVNACKCIPFEFSALLLDVEEYTSCSWDRLICIYKEIDKVQRDVRDIISLNQCYQRCDYVQYDTQINIIKNMQTKRNPSETQSRVTAHFSETTCMKYRREVLYTWDQMLANLGGIFGLCLGGSIVSILEIIWFALDLLCTVLQETFKAIKIQPKTDDTYENKVFLINQRSPRSAKKVYNVKAKDFKRKKGLNISSDSKFKFIH